MPEDSVLLFSIYHVPRVCNLFTVKVVLLDISLVSISRLV